MEANDKELFNKLLLALGFLAVKDIEDNNKKIKTLDKLKFSNPEIALICDMTPGSVKTIKSLVKSSKASSKNKNSRNTKK